jgi:small subunit ribosomal protein S3
MGQKIHPLGFRLGITQNHRAQWFSKPREYLQYLQEDQILRNFFSQELSGTALPGSNGKTGLLGISHFPKKKKEKGPFSDAGLSKTLITRRADRLFIELHVQQPKIVTGEAGVRLKELTAAVQKIQKTQAEYRTTFTRPRLVSTNPAGINESTNSASEEAEVDPERIQAPLKTTPGVVLQIVQVAQPSKDARLLAQKVAQQLENRVAFRRIMKQTIQQAREAGVEGIKIQISGRLNGAEIARREWAREGRVPLHTLRANIDYCSYPAQTIYGLLGIKIWIYTGQKTAQLES